jgi:hypothetical protein
LLISKYCPSGNKFLTQRTGGTEKVDKNLCAFLFCGVEGKKYWHQGKNIDTKNIFPDIRENILNAAQNFLKAEKLLENPNLSKSGNQIIRY